MTSTTDERRGRILARFDDLMRLANSWHVRDFLELDVTMAQAKLLYVTSARPDVSVSTIGAQLGIGLSAASAMVDRLVDHGYLERREDPHDRRQHLVRTSPEGSVALERIRALNERSLDRLMAGMSSAELEGLERGIDALVREARRIEEQPDPTRAEGAPA